jgi:ketosteroid isomerase-like protein
VTLSIVCEELFYAIANLTHLVLEENMKKHTLLLLIATLLTACGPAPQDVINSWQEAMNAGDMEKALSYLAEDAAVTIIPAMEGDGVYNGHAEIRGWYEPLLASKGVTTLSDCNVGGEIVTCLNTYADEGLKSMGVDFIEGDFIAVMREGKIQSYTLTIRPDSLAKFPPPPEPTIEPTVVSMLESTITPIPDESTPTPLPEVRVTNSEAIIGKWSGKSGDYIVSQDFQADGTMIVSVSEFGAIGSGPYVFEDNLLKFEDATGDCSGLIARYEVYGTYQEEQLSQLRFVLVGNDQCLNRKRTLAGKTLLPPEP